MTILCALLLAGLAVAMLFPETRAGRWLHKVLIDAPAEWLRRERLWKTLTIVGAAVLMVALAMGAPELIPLLAVGDLAMWIDIMALSLLLGAGARIRHGLAAAARFLRRVGDLARGVVNRLGSRAPRTPRRPARKPPRNTDPEPGWTHAFA